MKYITLQAFSIRSGYSAGAVRQKINRGEWIDGKQYVKAPDGRILINIEEFEKWAEESLLEAKRLSKSHSRTKAKGVVNLSHLSPRPLT